MRLDRELGLLGKQRYEQLKGTLEAEALGKRVCINIHTGEYVLGATSREAYEEFKSRFGDAPSFEAWVGESPYVFNAGAL